MSAVAITVEGVLRKSMGGAKIPVGVELYYALATRAKIVLLTGEMQAEAGLEHWLLIEGMTEHVRIMWSDVVMRNLTPSAERITQVNTARQMGYDIQMVVEPNPAVSAGLLVCGYTVSTFTHAEYTVPAWRPDAKLRVKSWDELEAEVDRQTYLRATDTRKEEK